MPLDFDCWSWIQHCLLIGQHNVHSHNWTLQEMQPLAHTMNHSSHMAWKGQQKKWILKADDLHITISQLQWLVLADKWVIVPELWVECHWYGPATTRQMLEGKHIQRAIEAHIITVSALYSLLQDEFTLENLGTVKNICCQAYENCKILWLWAMMEAHSLLVSTQKEMILLKPWIIFLNKKKSEGRKWTFIPSHMHLYGYILRILVLFLRSVRTSNWDPNLTALQAFNNCCLP